MNVFTFEYGDKIVLPFKYQIYSGKACSLIGNTDLHLFGRNEFNEKICIVIQGFKPYFYVECEEGDFESFKGDKLIKMEFKDMMEFHKAKKNFDKKYESDLFPVKRFMIDEKLDMSFIKPRILYIDFETDGLFGDILSCSFSLNDDLWCVLGEEEVKNEFKRLDELELFDGIASYHNYDKVVMENNDILSENKRLEGKYFYIDLYKMFRKAWYKEGLPDFKLDTVCRRVIGEGKVEVNKKEIGKLSEEKLMEYNIQDTKLIRDLDKKMGLSEIRVNVALINGSEIKEALSVYSVCDFAILKFCKDLNIILPDSKKGGSKGNYKGAYVYAKYGLYKDVGVWDYASLYPSAILAKNISFETHIGGGEFSKDTIGIVPQLVSTWISERKKVGKKTMMGNGYKVLANGLYGYLGFTTSRIFNTDVAGAVTKTCRKLIEGTKNTLEKHGYNVVLVDTDSCYVCDVKDDESITKIINDFLKENNYKYFAMEYEGNFKKGYVIKKKQYYLQDNNGEDKIRGIALRRGDVSKFLNKVYKEAIVNIMNGMSKTDVYNIVKKRVNQDIYETDIKDLVTPIGLNRNTSVKTQQCRAVEYSEKHFNYIHEEEDKVRVIPVKMMPSKYPKTDVIAYCKEIENIRIIYDYESISRVILNRIDTLYPKKEKDDKYQKTLDDWF